ncbi:MAG: Ig-like domain-containing protein [Myxococcota bacterium]
MHRSLLLLPLLVACSGGDDKGTDTAGGDSGSDTNGCDVIVDSTLPASGAIDADYRAAIEFHLSDADPTATVSSSIAGTTTLADDNETVIFTPSAPLAPSTDYTVTLEYCGGTVDLGFKTSSLGTPLPDTNVLVGKTFALDLAGARIVEPAGIGSVLSSYLTQDILVGVDTVSATEINMTGAIGKEDASPPAQDFCTPTIDFPVADFDEQPFFQIGPQTTTLSVAGYSIEIGNLEITGTFASDASYFGGGTLSGTIDTRPLAPLLDDSGDEGAICDLAVSFGAVCEACPSDGEPFCLTLVADQIVAVEVEGTSLSEVAGSDCEGCESGPPAPDAVCAEE